METLLLFIVAVVVVLVTSLVKMPWFNRQVKVAVATVTSVVGAAVHLWLTGDFEAIDLTATILQVFGGSQLIYQFILANSDLDKVLERVASGRDEDADA